MLQKKKAMKLGTYRVTWNFKVIGLMFTKWLHIDCIVVFENGYFIRRQLIMGGAATKSGLGNNTKI